MNFSFIFRIEGAEPKAPGRVHKVRKSRAKRVAPASAAKTTRRARARRLKSGNGLSGVGIFRVVAILLVVIVGAGAFGFAWHRRVQVSDENKKLLARVDKGPVVETTKVKMSPDVQKLILQGECRPFYESTVFAKVSGYLKTIRVYEGDVVRKGDILATVSSPETDQALISAKADAGNKKRVAQRYRILLDKQLASPQEAEQAFAESNMAQAQLRSALEAKNYETLRAPFDGVVTARFVDPGALIPNASSSRSAQLALLTVADMRKLKIDAYVDQRYAGKIQVGQAVEIHLPNRNNEKFPGEVARLSGSLDPRTRMLFVEVDFDNKDQQIVSGSFVNVDLTFDRAPMMMVPVNALVQHEGKSALAVVGDDRKLRFSTVEIVDNDGTNLMIASGVKAGQLVALNIGSEMKDGAAVQYSEAAKDSESSKPGAGAKPGDPGPSQVLTGGKAPATDETASSRATDSNGQQQGLEQKSDSNSKDLPAQDAPAK